MSRSYSRSQNQGGRHQSSPTRRHHTAAHRGEHEQAGNHPSLAGLPPAIWQIGNAAMSQLLDPQGNGRSLDSGILAEMEQRFGADFTGVRIHQAPTAAAALNARAFVQGENIYLGANAPSLDAPEGKSLVAHELAHVVQQRQAGVVNDQQVSQPGDRFEQAADRAAQQVMQGQQAQLATSASPPAIQCQEEKPQTIAREEVQKLLTDFLQQQLEVQGGRSLRVTPEVRMAVEKIFVGDVGRLIAIQSWLQSPFLPGLPAEFAEQVTRRLPSTILEVKVAHLKRSNVSETPSKMERVQNLITRTAPSELPPEMQIKQWRFDQEAKDLRRNENVTGPYNAPDVLRLGRIIGGLPGALKPPAAKPTQARSYPEVEQAISQVAPDTLIPAEVKDKPSADSFADAKEVARYLAAQLDIAQQKGRESIDLRLGDNYNKVADRDAMKTAIESLVRLVRNALPHHATKVTYVDVYFGDRWVTRCVTPTQ